MSAYHASYDDRVLARLLITNWTLTTGRTLPADVPPASLSREALIWFWCDDQVAAADETAPATARRGAAR